MKNDKIIFYDGYCNVCDFFVRMVIKNNSKKTIKFASLQSDFAKNNLPKYLNILPISNSVLYLNKNKIYNKSEAVFEILKELDFPISLLRVLKIFPMFFTDWFYDLVAKYRYKIFSQKITCEIPPGFDSSLFIDI